MSIGADIGRSVVDSVDVDLVEASQEEALRGGCAGVRVTTSWSRSKASSFLRATG
jgi:hypothetical protein